MRALPSFAAVIVAAGKGLRAGGAVPKQFAMWNGKPLLRHSAESLASAGALPIVVAIPEGGEKLAQEALSGIEGFQLVIGGSTRQESVCRALEMLDGQSIDMVLVHDAARPDLPEAVIERLVSSLETNLAAIPVLPVVDSIAVAEGATMVGSANRDELRRTQTPQAFRFSEILGAHKAWTGEPTAGDDAQVAIAAGINPALVDGDERLRKLTFADDFAEEMAVHVRTGMGFDVHRFAAGEELWLCGIRIEHDEGLAGHSDADVALHAVVDAVLGAVGEGDIGQHFPPSEAKWKDAGSGQFVEHAVALAEARGYRPGNVDLTIICEEPKIGPHREAMRLKLSQLLGIAPGDINVKATTTERLGFTGRGEGIAAQAVATMVAIRP